MCDRVAIPLGHLGIPLLTGPGCYSMRRASSAFRLRYMAHEARAIRAAACRHRCGDVQLRHRWVVNRGGYNNMAGMLACLRRPMETLHLGA